MGTAFWFCLCVGVFFAGVVAWPWLSTFGTLAWFGTLKETDGEPRRKRVIRHDHLDVNPATGLLMVGTMDSDGNPYGCSPDD